jgi:hypothetical protein
VTFYLTLTYSTDVPRHLALAADSPAEIIRQLNILRWIEGTSFELDSMAKTPRRGITYEVPK